MMRFRLLRWGDYPGLSGWALTAIRSIRETQREIRHRRRRGSVTTEPVTGMTEAQIKGCWWPPEVGRGGNRFSSRVSRGSTASLTLDHIPDFWPPELREHISVVWSHQVRGKLLQQPQELIYCPQPLAIWASSQGVHSMVVCFIGHGKQDRVWARRKSWL